MCIREAYLRACVYACEQRPSHEPLRQSTNQKRTTRSKMISMHANVGGHIFLTIVTMAVDRGLRSSDVAVWTPQTLKSILAHNADTNFRI